jgi:hypothetical protein
MPKEKLQKKGHHQHQFLRHFSHFQPPGCGFGNSRCSWTPRALIKIENCRLNEIRLYCLV